MTNQPERGVGELVGILAEDERIGREVGSNARKKFRNENWDALRARAERGERALRWYNDHKSQDGSYDGGLFGDLSALAPPAQRGGESG